MLASRQRLANLQWDEGYAELLVEAQKAREADELDLVTGTIEYFTEVFREKRRYESTSRLLNSEGKAALLELASIGGIQMPLTSLTAAELGVKFNGLLYDIDAELRSTTDQLLNNAALGDHEESQPHGRWKIEDRSLSR